MTDLAGNIPGNPQIPAKATAWDGYATRIYTSRRAPQPLGTVDFDEIEELARKKLADYPQAFMYAKGSAGRLETEHANRRAFQKYAIIPRMLTDCTVRNLEITLFGVKHPSPILIAPIGVQGIFNPEAELDPARAGAKLGIPFIMSTVSSRSIEQVAEANGPNGHRWYQLYWPKTNEIILSILKRAKASGFTALVVTLDTMNLGWRPHDLEYAYMPFAHGYGNEIGRSDPVFMGSLGREVDLDHRTPFPYDANALDAKFAQGDPHAKEEVTLGLSWITEVNSGKFRTWDDLKFLRDNWDGPLILKGIQSVKDAEKALQHGVDGISVSNHGGRQLDGALPSLYALANIMKSSLIKEAQKSGKLTVLFDSGIRTGPDIFKAIALGAQAVLLGRPWLYGGIAGGQAGIEQVLTHTLSDLETTMACAGVQSISELHGTAEESLQKLDF